MLPKLILLLLISSSCIAQTKSLDSLFEAVRTGANDTNKVNAYRQIAGLVRDQDQKKAIQYGLAGVALAKGLHWDKGIAGCYLNTSTAFIFASRFDSAMIYIDSAIVYALKDGEVNRLALAYLNKADILRQLWDFKSSITYCNIAMKYATKAGNDDRKARIFQTIGSVYMHQELYDQCIAYYNKAHELYVKNRDVKMTAIILNNLGHAYKNTQQYPKANEHFTQAIHLADSLHDLNNLSLFYSGLAGSYFYDNKLDEATINNKKAFELAVQQDDPEGVADGHLLFANIYYKQEKYNQALASGVETYRIAKENSYLPDLEMACEVLSKIMYNLGNYKAAYDYFKEHKILSDSLNKEAYNEQIAAMQTTFDLNEKQETIKTLNTEKLLNQKELKSKNLLNLMLVGGFVLSAVIAFVLYNRYKLKQRLKEVEVRNKIAADLHDDVGATLSSIRMYSDIVKNQVSGNSTAYSLLDKISVNSKEMVETMSDIVWMIKPGNDAFQNLEDRMLNFSNELCVPNNIQLTFERSTGIDDIKIPMEQRKNLFLLFKEAISNAVKYSGCTKIEVRFTMEEKRFVMMIADNGKGFDVNNIKHGNGLDNMRKRTTLQKGKLDIFSTPNEGTTITFQMHIP